jgi:hypothetical protein
MYTLIGKIVDTDNKPIEFGSIYTSDSKGNPTSRVNSTTSDDKGRWKLEGINDTDFITAQFVGFDKKTISAKSNIKVPIPFSNAFSRNLIIKLPLSKSGNLSEVEVIAQKAYKSSGSKRPFRDWLRSEDGKGIVNELTKFVNVLVNPQTVTGGSTGSTSGGSTNGSNTVPKEEDKKETKILGMSPITFGIVSLLTIAVTSFVAYKIIKSKK